LTGFFLLFKIQNLNKNDKSIGFYNLSLGFFSLLLNFSGFHLKKIKKQIKP
jgi:hypothetical protein